MSAKTYWKLLVLLGILCEGIISTFAEMNVADESSEFIVRQKRVINRLPGGDERESIKNVPYIVTVKQIHSRQFCVGAILSNKVVLTIAQCVASNIVYRVYSGTARKPNSGVYETHNVTDKRLRMTNNPSRPSSEGIALITVTPLFIYSLNTYYIELYEGPIYHGLHGIVSGWGCIAGNHPGTAHPNYLRSISVPIINSSDCARLHPNTFAILDSDICTFDTTGNQFCGVDDIGAPLVTAGNNYLKLVGIHLSSGGGVNGRNPDVFANLQHPRYKTWIAQTINILDHNLHT